VFSNTHRPLFTPRKDPVPIVQDAGWAPEPVWTGGKSRPHRDSIPDHAACSSVTIPTELPDPHYYMYIYEYIYIYIYVCVCVLVQIISNEQKKCTDAHKNKSSGHLETRYLMFRRSVISLSGGGPWFSPTAVHVRFKEIKGTW